MSRKTLLALIILIIIALLVGLISSRVSVRQSEPANSILPEGPYKVTVVGRLVCLPHAEGVAPTKECMPGLQTPDSSNYALDTSKATSTLDVTATDTNVIVTGTLVPIEQISTDRWQQYEIEGIISAETISSM